MSCDDIREKISMMADDELNEEDRAFITEHLAACPECMQVYEAFTAISDVLSDLEEVPDGFTEAVMHKVHAQAAAPKRRRNFTRILGLAACVALVLFASRNLDDLTHLSNSAAPFSMHDDRTAEPPTPSPEGPVDTDPSEVNAKLMSYGYVTLTNNAALYNDISPTATEESGASIGNQHENSALPEEMMETVDTTTVEQLLSMSEPADYGMFTTQPDYTAIFHDDDSSFYSLEIWISEDRLYCEDDSTGTAYYAVGSSDQFLELIGQ